jgi:hypothetical protein
MWTALNCPMMSALKCQHHFYFRGAKMSIAHIHIKFIVRNYQIIDTFFFSMKICYTCIWNIRIQFLKHDCCFDIWKLVLDVCNSYCLNKCIIFSIRSIDTLKMSYNFDLLKLTGKHIQRKKKTYTVHSCSKI